MHPMIEVERLTTSPADAPVFGIVIKYPAGEWRYQDRHWESESAALAEIPMLQATGRLPTDDELNAS